MRKRYLLVPVLVLGLLAVTSAPGRRAISVAVLDLARGGTIGGATTISGDLTVNGDAGVSNNARVTGTFGVTGAATFGTIVSAPILDGGAVIGTTGNFSGDISADHYHATALATENAFNAVQSAHYTFNDPTNTVYMDYNGTNLEVVGAPLAVPSLISSGNIYSNNVILDGGSRLCLNGTGACTVYLASDGFGGVAAAYGGGYNATGAFSVTGDITTDGYAIPKTGLKNTATSAACSANTGAVCVNDTGGLAVADGSGTTVATISNAGAGALASLTLNGVAVAAPFDWSNSATSLAATGTTVFAEFGATAQASTITAANWTPAVVGVGGGNFVVKYCGDSACAGTTYVTCTAACTAAVGTPVACTINTAAVAKAADPFAKITTACATTNPQGNFTAHHTAP